MQLRSRELERTLLVAFAAVPLYVTGAVSVVAVAMFHVLIAVSLFKRSGSEAVLPSSLLNALAAAYLIFFPIDGIVISRSLIRASVHLLFFIAIYLTYEAAHRTHRKQLLVAFLIFTTSVATATHLSVVLFVAVFAFLMFRQLMTASEEETAEATGVPYSAAPFTRSAAAYLIPAFIAAAILFPILPRSRNPFVPALAGALASSSTGISDSIDFNKQRTISNDPDVIARVWMSHDALALFTPVRLRAAVYDSFSGNRWSPTLIERGERRVPFRRGAFRVAHPRGFSRTVRVLQKPAPKSRLMLPVGAYAVSGVPFLLRGPAAGVYTGPALGHPIHYEASISRETLPASRSDVRPLAYPVTPEVTALARRIIGNSTAPQPIGSKLEAYLASNFQYEADPENLRQPITTEQFLLRDRRGHCEYFAAGMVVLLTSLDIPARIVGGYYGGELNPLTGYLVIRKRDAHAWVEAWDGERWMTFDPTPPAERPGNTRAGLLRAYATAVGESITYFWDRYILTFGLQDQVALIAAAISRVTATMRMLRGIGTTAAAAAMQPWVIGMFIFIIALGTVAFHFRRRPRDPFDRLLYQLRRRGIEVDPAMSDDELMTILDQRDPELARAAGPILRFHRYARFSPAGASPELRAAALQAWRTLRAAR